MSQPAEGPQPRGGTVARRRAAYAGLALLALLAGVGYAQREVLRARVAGLSARSWDVPDIDTAGMTPNVVDALAAARQAVLDAPASHAAWYDFAAALHAHALHAEAIEAYRRASALRPDDPRPYYLQAILLPGEGGSVVDSLALFERTAAMDPRYPPVWLRMGQLLANDGRMAEATQALQHAVELDPAYPMAHRELGLALLERGDTSGALLHLTFAANLEEDDYPTWAGLSRAYRQAGLNDEAQEAAERSIPLIEVASYRDSVLDDVLNRGVGPVHLERLADAYMKAQAWRLAIETLKRVERDLPGSEAIQRKLAESYAAAGDAALALAHQRRADELRTAPSAPAGTPP